MDSTSFRDVHKLMMNVDYYIQAGPLEKVTLPTDHSGRPRGFGFIQFKHQVSVNYAINLLQGIKLFGQPLKLQAKGCLMVPH